MRAQNNRAGKMEQMYEYITGPEFRQRVTTIVESFNTMRSDVKSQKASIDRHWKRQADELDKAFDCSTTLHGKMWELASGKIKVINQLEIDSGHNERLSA